MHVLAPMQEYGKSMAKQDWGNDAAYIFQVPFSSVGGGHERDG